MNEERFVAAIGFIVATRDLSNLDDVVTVAVEKCATARRCVRWLESAPAAVSAAERTAGIDVLARALARLDADATRVSKVVERARTPLANPPATMPSLDEEGAALAFARAEARLDAHQSAPPPPPRTAIAAALESLLLRFPAPRAASDD